MPRDPASISDATFRLFLAPGIGPVTLARLRERFENDEAIAHATVNQLVAIKGIGDDTARALVRALHAVDPARERDSMTERSVRLILFDDSDYPPLLKTIADPPPALWIRGDLLPEDNLALAIVGSRRCSAYGREQSGRFSALLAQSGLTIISGGASGIDSEAHRGALRVQGRTIAIMGCGFEHCYPPDHADLFNRIADGHGALLSEFPMSVAPVAGNFPRRNRIISGMSLGVLVIEAAKRSGALITARLAAEEHHREVMALPGRIDAPSSAGCLRAIRDGWASCIIDHADILQQLDNAGHQLRATASGSTTDGQAPDSPPTSLFDDALTKDQHGIIEILHNEGRPLAPDQIAARSGLPLSQLMADLTLLEIRRRIKKGPQGIVLSHSSST